MDFLKQLSEHTKDSGIDISSLLLSQDAKRKLASLNQSFVYSNLVPSNSSSSNFVFAAANQKEFFLITTSGANDIIEGGENNTKKLTACEFPSQSSSSSVTALHLISVSSKMLLLVAAFDDQSFYAWNISSSQTKSLLLGYAETDARITSITELK